MFAFTRGERVFKEENNVVYHGGHSRLIPPMTGKLLLTTERFAFLEYQLIKSGLFQKEIRTTIRINVPVTSITGASVETRLRKKGTTADPPSFLSKESYRVIIILLEIQKILEKPSFEVSDTEAWQMIIQDVTESLLAT